MVALSHGSPIDPQKEFIVKNYTGPITIEVIESLKNAETLEIIDSTITNYPTRIFSRLPKIKKVVVLRSTFKTMDPTIYEGKILFIHSNNNKLKNLSYNM